MGDTGIHTDPFNISDATSNASNLNRIGQEVYD